MSEYISGACNIGPAEIKRRKQGAYLGGALYLIVAIFLVASDTSRTTRLWAFLPATLFAVGYIQSKRKFCVAYGFLGIFNFEKLGSTTKIKVNQDLKADRKYAIKLMVQALLLAAVLTALIAII